ncbi:hypothetical protein DPMN_003939 [Dreissena polymorpha]|uniref:Uncharacterized protein n=1 Tax=Dreissena polymorpha TaxID=45954 RepID=A0A9D4MLW7_DREPO|nr:hypothetical protein DPMN_003939 [Dreissena polymorpha]
MYVYVWSCTELSTSPTIVKECTSFGDFPVTVYSVPGPAFTAFKVSSFPAPYKA